MEKRRESRTVYVRGVPIGGGAPVLVQSMTKTPTHEVEATLDQIHSLAAEGCELVRVAVPDMKAARALGEIISRSSIPVVADIHFDWRLALEALERGVHKLRLNPGNFPHKEHLAGIVKRARERGVPIRIGVNEGSLEKALIRKHGGITAEALAESALLEVKRLEALDFTEIVISVKCFDIALLLEVHELLAQRSPYPFHIGVTEAGAAMAGLVRSALGIGSLLMRGIGDTVRVSLTSTPLDEVKVAYEILKALGLRKRGATIVSCPTCGRTQIDIPRLVRDLEERLHAMAPMEVKIAVMGCVVNGPGEARQADIGIAGGKGEGALFRGGKIVRKVKENHLIAALMEELESLQAEKNGP
ncbi:MAG: flavodoxin-dependent (E)-4-hydroxy-3-methylbut-2-enyl-diphosphate synthase [Candidatus Eremiobacteraeota bacterium]|nr:flavodoxin-dependent (E)-4-hydroxy-3-methylbut-2-enyl-diphosphate synthase [Candidatus Eremiobacteraeota bacterium]